VIPEQYRKTVLPSGLRIVSETIPYVRSLSIGVWIDIGSRDERPDESGISHFVEHAVFKGTNKRRTHHIAQYLEAVGGFLNAFTTKDTTCYYARILDKHRERALEILSDLVIYPAFPEREVEKEKQVILEEMKGAEDDPEDIINDHLDGILFGKHALAQPIIGTRDAVMSFNSDGLRDFINSRYTAQNIVISASGSLDHDKLVASCERKFAELPGGNRNKRTKPRKLKPKESVLQMSSQQSHLVMGRVVPGLCDADYYLLNVFNTLLGDGMSSRLFQNVREKFGYSYNVYSSLLFFEDTGVLSLYAGAENGTIHKAKSQMLKVLESLRNNNVSQRELQRAKEQVIGGIILGLESMDSRMHRLGRDELSIGKEIPVQEMLQQIQSIKLSDMEKTVETLCDTESFSTVLILPSD
jgi:predicted Zn-dependent peptidase